MIDDDLLHLQPGGQVYLSSPALEKIGVQGKAFYLFPLQGNTEFFRPADEFLLLFVVQGQNLLRARARTASQNSCSD
jgi:hypothetical protein